MYLMHIVSIPFPLDSMNHTPSIVRYTIITMPTFWYGSDFFPLSDWYPNWIPLTCWNNWCFFYGWWLIFSCCFFPWAPLWWFWCRLIWWSVSLLWLTHSFLVCWCFGLTCRLFLYCIRLQELTKNATSGWGVRNFVSASDHYSIAATLRATPEAPQMDSSRSLPYNTRHKNRQKTKLGKQSTLQSLS